MLLLAAVMTFSISVDLDLSRLIRAARPARPPATCGIAIVGYRITGQPRQTFRYGGETYVIPAEGYVELIALPRRARYEFEGRTLPLDGPRDPLGFAEVALPLGR